MGAAGIAPGDFHKQTLFSYLEGLQGWDRIEVGSKEDFIPNSQARLTPVTSVGDVSIGATGDRHRAGQNPYP